MVSKSMTATVTSSLFDSLTLSTETALHDERRTNHSARHSVGARYNLYCLRIKLIPLILTLLSMSLNCFNLKPNTMIYEVYPESFDWMYQHVCYGERPAWSYLDGEAQSLFGYDIFTCSPSMIWRISQCKVAEEFECWIIEPGTGKRIEAIAMESTLLSMSMPREYSPQVYVFLKSDKETIRQRRNQMINRVISFRLNN
jgi:hypothetical protein